MNSSDTASAMRTIIMAQLASITNVVMVATELSAKEEVPARRKLVCACVMLHTMELVVRVAKDQARCAFRVLTRTALVTAEIMESAIKSQESVHVKHRRVSISTEPSAEGHAGSTHTWLIGPDQWTSGAGQHAKMIS